jgi:hypothetical protein
MKTKPHAKKFCHALKNVCNKLNINCTLGFWWEIVLVCSHDLWMSPEFFSCNYAPLLDG